MPGTIIIDPGKHTGWAYATDRIVVSGSFYWHSEWELLKKAGAVFSTYEWETLVIEQQFLGNNFKAVTGILLGRDGCVFAAATHKKHTPWALVDVAPTTWQSQILRISGDRKVLGFYAMREAERLLDRKITSADEASAVCMAAWHIRRTAHAEVTRLEM